MLREILEHTGIQPEKIAGLLGISPTLFQEYLASQRQVPQSILSIMSNVIGIDLAPYASRKVPSQEAAAVTPAIWYRFRGANLVHEDREFVFLIRRLGYFVNELEEITGARAVGWKSLFQEIRQSIDIQAPPRVQGIQAANMFRESRGLSVGACGIGESLRGNLRSMGALVVETPVPESRLEGCCFYVGNRPTERPCIFANTHHSTWFRRNFIILHEIAHAIFDAESMAATLDFRDEAECTSLSEQRADAFAQQVLVPRQVLFHLAQKRGIAWDKLTADSLAHLIADTHTEKLTVLRAALESELIDQQLYATYLELDVSTILPLHSTHALSTAEYIRTAGVEAESWLGKRDTTVPSASLRLPPAYVQSVLAALQAKEISRGKAAEFLMIDDAAFRERFAEFADANERDQESLALSH